MSASRWIHLDVSEIVKTTEGALLCRIGDDEMWIPRSQIADGDDYSAGDAGLTLSVTRWFAGKEGLSEID